MEAIQWDGHIAPIRTFFGGYSKWGFDFASTLTIYTLEGDMEVSLGDYIIKGVKGEFYPCKPDIFEMTYEYVG